MFGEYTAWPADMLLLVQSMLNICMGSIFRRFFVAFSGWPWQLCRLVDPMASNEMRRRVAGRFSDAKSCCLDEYFSRRLKALLGDAADDPDTYVEEGFLV